MSTYRSLRIGIVILVLMLFVSVFIQAGAAGWCLQSTISAYYFTDVHAIFIDVLCALGALLLVYKGSTDTEDVLYDFAGFWAFFVAVVPAGWPTNLDGDAQGRVRGLCGGGGLPLDFNAGQALNNNVSVVFVGVLLVLLASILFAGRFAETWTIPGAVARIVGVLITAVLAFGFVYTPHWFERHGHSLAAISLFTFVILAVWVNASLSDRDRYVLAYRVVGITMLATLIVVLVLASTVRWSLWVLLAEAALILQFGVFWVIQTVELWKVAKRRAVASML